MCFTSPLNCALLLSGHRVSNHVKEGKWAMSSAIRYQLSASNGQPSQAMVYLRKV